MSETVTRGQEAGQQAEVLAAAGTRETRGRGRWVALGIVVVVAAGAVSAWRAGVISPAASSGAGQGAPAPATAAVTRQDIAATTPLTATLGYAGSFPVTGRDGGTLTWLPQAGRVIRQGHALYRTGNGSPVVLLYGSVPDWRPLGEGVTGQDVSQLNHDLVALGDADRAEYLGAGLGLLLLGDGGRGGEAAIGAGGLRPVGVAAAGVGGVRAGGDPGQPGDREPGRPGVRTGAGRNVGPARGHRSRWMPPSSRR